MSNTVTGFKLYWFVIRYWCIGKTHCDIPNWAKRIAKFMCAVFWMFLFYSLAVLLAKLLFGITIVRQGQLW